MLLQTHTGREALGTGRRAPALLVRARLPGGPLAAAALQLQPPSSAFRLSCILSAFITMAETAASLLSRALDELERPEPRPLLLRDLSQRFSTVSMSEHAARVPHR